MAPSNGTTSTPPKLVVTLPPNHSTLQWHLQWHHPQSWPSPSPPLAHYNGTLQWHPAMAPSNGNTSAAPSNGTTSTPSGRHPSSTLHWHPAMAPPLPPHHGTLQWHPAMVPSNGTTSTPPKLVVTLPSPHHSTLQWHPAMAPRPLPQSWSSPSPGPLNHSTLQWNPTMAPSNGTTSTAPCNGTLVPRPIRQSGSSPSPLLEVRTPIAIAIWGIRANTMKNMKNYQNEAETNKLWKTTENYGKLWVNYEKPPKKLWVNLTNWHKKNTLLSWSASRGSPLLRRSSIASSQCLVSQRVSRVTWFHTGLAFHGFPCPLHVGIQIPLQI